MALVSAIAAVRQYWAPAVVAFFLLRALKRRYLSPVSDVPALNFLSTISRLGKVREVLSGKTEKTLLEAHRKYGKQTALTGFQLQDTSSLDTTMNADCPLEFYRLHGANWPKRNLHI
jgi:hypothetical protein